MAHSPIMSLFYFSGEGWPSKCVSMAQGWPEAVIEEDSGFSGLRHNERLAIFAAQHRTSGRSDATATATIVTR